MKRFNDWRLTESVWTLVKKYAREKEQMLQGWAYSSASEILTTNERHRQQDVVCDNFDEGLIPSIVYGHVVSNFAQGHFEYYLLFSHFKYITFINIANLGGAEIQSYQLICEMLERGVKITQTTIDQVVLGLAKGGSHSVLLQIHDILLRYNIRLSNLACNAILNACDKSEAYGVALGYYFFKMKPSALDLVAASVLLKACDRSGNAKCATIIVMQASQLLKVFILHHIKLSIFTDSFVLIPSF